MYRIRLTVIAFVLGIVVGYVAPHHAKQAYVHGVHVPIPHELPGQLGSGITMARNN